MPTVSVYLPTRDRLALLQRAVASVLAQSFVDFELIVVDDGGRDGSDEWLRETAARDPRVVVMRHDEPQGAPRSRNRAIAAARSRWVTGLDDDDEFAPRRLESFVEVAVTYERLGVPFSALYSQDLKLGDGDAAVVTRKPARVGFEDLFRGNTIGNQFFARREVFVDAGLYDEAMPAWQDLDLALRITARHGAALLVDLPLYRYRDDPRPDRISHGGGKARIVAAYERLAAKWPAAPAPLRQALYLQVLGSHYGFGIDASDWWRYLRLGPSPGSIRRLLRRGREIRRASRA